MNLEEKEKLAQQLKEIGENYGTNIVVHSYGIETPQQINKLPTLDQIFISNFLNAPIITDDFTTHNLRRKFCDHLRNLDPLVYQFLELNALRLNLISLLLVLEDEQMSVGLVEYINNEITHPDTTKPANERSIYDNKSPLQKVAFVIKIKKILVGNLENWQPIIK